MYKPDIPRKQHSRSRRGVSGHNDRARVIRMCDIKSRDGLTAIYFNDQLIAWRNGFYGALDSAVAVMKRRGWQ